MRDMLDDDEVEHAPPPHPWRYWLGAAIALAGLICFFVLPHNSTTKHAHFDFVTNITMAPPPPPPPPPPRPPQPQKAPTPEQKTVTATPKTVSHAAPNTPLTARAGPGSNAYGLAQGNGSGDDTIGGGGGDGQDWSSYSPVISAALQTAISGDDVLRSGQWAGQVRFWFNGAGIVTKAEMSESTGDTTRDREIERRILGRLIQTNLPADMPQPVTVAITSSST